jgi:urease accessory protein
MVEPGGPTARTPPLATLRLWQLVSPALPVGAYAYSDGLESAVEAGWVSGEADAFDWIEGLAGHALARLDLPVLARLYRASERREAEPFAYWAARLLASRETAELREADRRMGLALDRLLEEIGCARENGPPAGFAAAFSRAAVEWRIPLAEAAAAYAWIWCESRVAAAIKLVPLGQAAGQRILFHLAGRIPDLAARALCLDDDAIGAAAPGLAIASSRHERQYSRLFQS